MTLKNLFVANLSDIDSIRLSCRKCGAHIAYDPDKTIHVSAGCPQCNQQWTVAEKSAMDELLRALSVVKENEKSPTALRIAMEFHGIDQEKTS